MEVKTVVIYHPDLKGPCIINEEDFDPAKHTLFKDKKGKFDGDGDNSQINKAPEGQMIVGKNGKPGRGSRFVILDDQGNKVGDNEFATEAEAFVAMSMLQKAE